MIRGRLVNVNLLGGNQAPEDKSETLSEQLKKGYFVGNRLEDWKAALVSDLHSPSESSKDLMLSSQTLMLQLLMICNLRYMGTNISITIISLIVL